MIQFNLLPDVKLQYLKVRRTQRLVIGGSLLVIAASALLLVVMGGTVFVFQKKNLSDLDGDVTKYTNQLKNTPDLNKVLTVQNQLNSLPALHNQKPVASRLSDYLKQLTPSTASIAQFQIDYGQHTMSFTGVANSLDVVNTFADTLKFTTFKQSTDTSTGKGGSAFTNVVLSQFSRSATGATYTITTGFDPAIFDSKADVKLTVPSIISTRSATEQPNALFQAAPVTSSTNASTSTNVKRAGN